ncbi:MAG TPA: serine hydrolase domain-containing protein [Chitinophagaceae bacterium]|nr:serine hydrolase domain-containing protein [Chitinophagaceae bacterium]
MSLASRMNALMESFYRPDAPGAALLVLKEGKEVLTNGYGLADMETREKISRRTNFRMASVSKQFTAMGTLLLAAKQALLLADPIGKYIDPLPPACRDITIEQLLTHTSGVRDYETLIPSSRSTPLLDEDVLNLLKGKEGTYFPPGERFRYSNTGYLLLALIIRQVSGMPFADFLKNHIFQPLNMSHSLVYQEGITIPERAYGYHFLGGAYHLADQSVTSATQGDGGVYTSLEDYLKWHQALETESLLSGQWTECMLASRADIKDGVGYGYGWFAAKGIRGGPCQFHSGESTGFRNIVYRHPASRTLIVLFSNRDDDSVARAFDALAAMAAEGVAAFTGGRSPCGPVPLFDWLHRVYEV